MNRREFLVRSSLFATAGLLVRSKLSAQDTAARPAAPKPAVVAATQPPPTVTEFRALRRSLDPSGEASDEPTRALARTHAYREPTPRPPQASSSMRTCARAASSEAEKCAAGAL